MYATASVEIEGVTPVTVGVGKHDPSATIRFRTSHVSLRIGGRCCGRATRAGGLKLMRGVEGELCGPVFQSARGLWPNPFCTSCFRNLRGAPDTRSNMVVIDAGDPLIYHRRPPPPAVTRPDPRSRRTTRIVDVRRKVASVPRKHERRPKVHRRASTATAVGPRIARRSRSRLDRCVRTNTAATTGPTARVPQALPRAVAFGVNSPPIAPSIGARSIDADDGPHSRADARDAVANWAPTSSHGPSASSRRA